MKVSALTDFSYAYGVEGLGLSRLVRRLQLEEKFRGGDAFGVTVCIGRGMLVAVIGKFVAEHDETRHPDDAVPDVAAEINEITVCVDVRGDAMPVRSGGRFGGRRRCRAIVTKVRRLKIAARHEDGKVFWPAVVVAGGIFLAGAGNVANLGQPKCRILADGEFVGVENKDAGADREEDSDRSEGRADHPGASLARLLKLLRHGRTHSTGSGGFSRRSRKNIHFKGLALRRFHAAFFCGLFRQRVSAKGDLFTARGVRVWRMSFFLVDRFGGDARRGEDEFSAGVVDRPFEFDSIDTAGSARGVEDAGDVGAVDFFDFGFEGGEGVEAVGAGVGFGEGGEGGELIDGGDFHFAEAGGVGDLADAEEGFGPEADGLAFFSAADEIDEVSFEEEHGGIVEAAMEIQKAAAGGSGNLFGSAGGSFCWFRGCEPAQPQGKYRQINSYREEARSEYILRSLVHPVRRQFACMQAMFHHGIQCRLQNRGSAEDGDTPALQALCFELATEPREVPNASRAKRDHRKMVGSPQQHYRRVRDWKTPSYESPGRVDQLKDANGCRWNSDNGVCEQHREGGPFCAHRHRCRTALRKEEQAAAHGQKQRAEGAKCWWDDRTRPVIREREPIHYDCRRCQGERYGGEQKSFSGECGPGNNYRTFRMELNRACDVRCALRANFSRHFGSQVVAAAHAGEVFGEWDVGGWGRASHGSPFGEMMK